MLDRAPRRFEAAMVFICNRVVGWCYFEATRRSRAQGVFAAFWEAGDIIAKGSHVRDDSYHCTVPVMRGPAAAPDWFPNPLLSIQRYYAESPPRAVRN